MPVHQLADAIGGARDAAALDNLSRAIWAGLAAGSIGNDDAQTLSDLIHARRAAEKAVRSPMTGIVPLGRFSSIFPAKRRQRSPDRAASITRRRTIAASGPLPPTLASKFTTGQVAVL